MTRVNQADMTGFSLKAAFSKCLASSSSPIKARRLASEARLLARSFDRGRINAEIGPFASKGSGLPAMRSRAQYKAKSLQLIATANLRGSPVTESLRFQALYKISGTTAIAP
jgi:hypothetical protein